MKLSKYKGYALLLIAILLVTIVFGAAMFGSIVDAKPQQLPVALVNLDEEVTLPDGSSFHIGDIIAQQLLSNEQLPIVWQQVSSEDELQRHLDDQDVYGAIVLPQQLSANLLSITTPNPNQAFMKVIYNEGMNTSATSVMKQVVQKLVPTLNEQLSQQFITQISTQTGGMIPASVVGELLAPIHLQEQTVHPIGDRQAMGNAPGLLTQMLWISNLVAALILFFIVRKMNKGTIHPLKNRLEQAAAGIIIPLITATLTIWMASSWYGMELATALDAWMWLVIVAYSFFYMQSALFNWIGMPAMAIFVLLMFFSMPVMNMAPQFLSDTTVTYLYNWTPLRIAASSIREVLYFDGIHWNNKAAIVITTIAVTSLVLLLLSSLVGGQKKQDLTISSQ